MLKVLSCVAYEHDLRLVAVSAIICALGCFTTTSLMARTAEVAREAYTAEVARRHRLCWLAAAAAVFGCSVWSLHFVAMLAFVSGRDLAYNIDLTTLSALVAAGGAFLALTVWQASLPRPLPVVCGGALLGIAVSGMHYVGVAAMTSSGMLDFDRDYVLASITVSVVPSAVALSRASDLRPIARRLEVGGWLALAICGLHFTGMAAVTVAPGPPDGTGGAVLGTTTLAIAVASVSLVILIASLAAVMIEQHLSQRALRDLERMRLMSNLAQEVLFIHRGGAVLEVNTAGERLFKAGATEIVGRPVFSLFTRQAAPMLIRRERCPPGERGPEEIECQAVDGTVVPVEITCQPIDYLGKPATVVALRDLTDRRRDEARIRHLARHDALTGLPNRFNLQERLDLAVDTAAGQGATLAVVYVDLDRFKSVNDLYGHAAGDAVLIQVARRVAAEIQAVDTLARVGGDEFVLMLRSEAGPERVSATATRIVEVLGQPFQVEGQRVGIGGSVGVAFYPKDGTSGDALVRAADVAMYRAKQGGRGGLCFFEASMNQQLQRRLHLGQELAGAVERGEMLLHFQPIVNGVTGEVESFEALIRWAHPLRGMIPPLDFIPLAEEAGLIGSIGCWVIETACREAAAWPQPWRVSVNVSTAQFRQSELCEVVGAALAASALAPSRLVVEITESVLIDDAAQAVATLNCLRAMGLRVALDDFGTGYSSLSYLQLFRFDSFKIDKSFVKRLGESDEAMTLTRTIVNLGHNLGLQVTAEGVETAAHLGILRSLGCDQMQGYLIGRPAAAGAFTDLDRLQVMALFGAERPSRAA